jgi:guanylate kinase
VGKGTVVRHMLQRDDRLWLSRSWTTRTQRPGEPDDAYNFVSSQQFNAHINSGGFLEYAEFLDNYYGTPMPTAPDGLDVVLEIDVQGARQVAMKFPEALLIFMAPPSAAAQEERLRKRGDPEDNIARRLEKAASEAEAGLELGAHVVVNDDLGVCVAEVLAIIEQARANR